MYLCQLLYIIFLLFPSLIFDSAHTKIGENFPIEKHRELLLRRGGEYEAWVGKEDEELFIIEPRTRPENLNINYFLNF